MELDVRSEDWLRCGDSGAVREKATVEVREVTLLNGFIPVQSSMVTARRDDASPKSDCESVASPRAEARRSAC
ncbi:hypothetical protein AAGS40_22380 [Paraburkholderia sp. PREW-6R]|uniref:hypothetical protein n=1 Tax=Paraburkholderia sp. PREW-6R TaxID=3141544 RepID=UPI0031F5DA12